MKLRDRYLSTDVINVVENSYTFRFNNRDLMGTFPVISNFIYISYRPKYLEV